MVGEGAHGYDPRTTCPRAAARGQAARARLPVAMTRFFNTTGPCVPEWHYMLPPEARLPEVDTLVARYQYFVVHAARQTGKTTAMRALAARFRGQGMVALHATLEASQGEGEVAAAEARWISAIELAARELTVGDRPCAAPSAAPGTRFSAWLQAWAEAVAPRPLVLFLDEADVVRGEALVNLLRQLRAGFHLRPSHFPASVALVGMRDLRDYLAAAKDGTPVNPGSPFNIKAKSLTLPAFTESEVAALYAQHTTETGQPFEPESVARAAWWSQGQPFLVNALAAACVDDLVTDRSTAISAACIDEAKERLVLSRTTHLHNLGERLREPRVAAIVSRVLAGDDDVSSGDDLDYCIDLGLLDPVARPARPANPLYREVIARQLSLQAQDNLVVPSAAWRRADGRLDAAVLVDGFLGWWRENAGFAERNNPDGYAEALVHLAFMAFLQRVVNGGGQIHREYAAGTGRVDLCVKLAGARTVIELKRVRPGRDAPERVLASGVEQLCAYLDTLGEREGWLLVFDQRPGLTWEARLWSRQLEVDGRLLHLRGA